jgi:hypothetical protein
MTDQETCIIEHRISSMEPRVYRFLIRNTSIVLMVPICGQPSAVVVVVAITSGSSKTRFGIAHATIWGEFCNCSLMESTMRFSWNSCVEILKAMM